MATDLTLGVTDLADGNIASSSDEESQLYDEFMDMKKECDEKEQSTNHINKMTDILDLNTIMANGNQIYLICNKIYSQMASEFDKINKNCQADDEDSPSGDGTLAMQEQMNNFEKLNKVMNQFECDLQIHSKNINKTIDRYTDTINDIYSSTVGTTTEINNSDDVEEYKHELKDYKLKLETLENEISRLKQENERLAKLRKKSPRKPLPTFNIDKQLPDPPKDKKISNDKAKMVKPIAPKNKPLPSLACHGTAKTHSIEAQTVVKVNAPTMPDI